MKRVTAAWASGKTAERCGGCGGEAVGTLVVRRKAGRRALPLCDACRPRFLPPAPVEVADGLAAFAASLPCIRAADPEHRCWGGVRGRMVPLETGGASEAGWFLPTCRKAAAEWKRLGSLSWGPAYGISVMQSARAVLALLAMSAGGERDAA